VLVPSFTFASSVNVILYQQATPVFVDIEPDTYNIDPEDLERKITPRTKAIMAVDVFGRYLPCFGNSSAYNDYAICVTCIA